MLVLFVKSLTPSAIVCDFIYSLFAELLLKYFLTLLAIQVEPVGVVPIFVKVKVLVMLVGLRV